MEVQNPDVAAGTVMQVFQPGYVIEDRVLRPAMVVVAKGGAKPGRAERGNDETPQPKPSP
jgi:molecular chaperone GrpE